VFALSAHNLHRVVDVGGTVRQAPENGVAEVGEREAVDWAGTARLVVNSDHRGDREVVGRHRPAGRVSSVVRRGYRDSRRTPTSFVGGDVTDHTLLLDVGLETGPRGLVTSPTTKVVGFPH
jgi:hypothetical protein